MSKQVARPPTDLGARRSREPPPVSAPRPVARKSGIDLETDAEAFGQALRLPEVAEILCQSVATVRRRIDTGKLHAFKDGRILRVFERDVLTYIKASRRWR